MTTAHRLNGAALAGMLHRRLAHRDVSTRHISFAAGELLFSSGDPAESFYVIERGRVRLEVELPGRDVVPVETLGPGDLVGLSWIFPSGRWNWQARAIGETVVEVFDASAVKQECHADVELRADVNATVANEAVRRLHAARLRLMDIYGSTR